MFKERREQLDNDRPPVVINRALVFVEKRPKDSNIYEPQVESYITQRPEIQSMTRSDFSRAGTAVQSKISGQRYPLNSRVENFDLRDNDGQTKPRQFMQ